MINQSDISIVVQGAVNSEITAQALNSLRRVFPNGEIILSTWEGSDISNLTFDKLILSEDLGSYVADEIAGVPNNVNRQLVSTIAGIKYATKKYILKTRTDIFLNSDSFLSCFEKYDKIKSPYFQNRLLICNYYTRNPRVFPVCFHPSDWLVFGRADDVRKYFENIPLMSAEDGEWFKTHEKTSAVFTNYLCRYNPEQHIFINFLRGFGSVECGCYYDCTPELIEQTERAFAECFVVLNYGKQLDITFSKYNPNRYLERHMLISYWQWKALYKHYCENKASALWFFYRTRALLLRVVTRLRRGIIRMLDRLGVKECVKNILTKLGKHRVSD